MYLCCLDVLLSSCEDAATEEVYCEHVNTSVYYVMMRVPTLTLSLLLYSGLWPATGHNSTNMKSVQNVRVEL